LPKTARKGRIVITSRAKNRRLWERRLKKLPAEDSSLPEILKIVRISQESQDTGKAWSDKTRRVINSKDLRDEVQVVHRGNQS